MKRTQRRILCAFAAVTVVLLIVLTIGSFFMLDFALRPTPNDGKDVTACYAGVKRDYPWITPWLDSLSTAEALRDTFIVNPDGIRLHALYVRADRLTDHTAVIVHGYTDSSVRMLMIGYLYHRRLGYNILLPDLQNCGLSGGDAIQMGWKDRLDVMQWMQVANATFGGHTRMVVHGISMGAATTMMVAGESNPNYVRCYVEDCGYTSVWDQFGKELGEQFHLPDFPLLYTASALCKVRYGWSFGEASALAQVSKCRLPMLFIHGDADAYVPTWMLYPLYEAKPQPKERWIVPGATHAMSYKMHPEAYTRRVEKFTKQYN
ncbi:MAG: alpha/beta hydrolase [Mediterranea sp.]|jgi:fermentation-respiration switch protein FrsA (DUF1100 family)|nr:alpha/beta hydrolase [Mediterranea sp.]